MALPSVVPFQDALPNVSGSGLRRRSMHFDGPKWNDGDGGELVGPRERSGLANVSRGSRLASSHFQDSLRRPEQWASSTRPSFKTNP